MSMMEPTGPLSDSSAAPSAPGQGISQDEAPVPRRRVHLGTFVAWLVIVLIVAGISILRGVAEEAPDPNQPDPVGVQMMKLQSRLLVGQSSLPGSSGAQTYVGAQTMNTGTLDQRLRFVALAGELMGPAEALAVLDRLREAVAARPDVVPTEAHEATMATLRILYDEYAAGRWSAPAVDKSARQALVHELGWFGKLALAPRESPDQAARDAVIDPAQRAMWFGVALVIVGVIAGVGGFAGLVIVIVLAFLGRLKKRIGPELAHGHVYVELFAAWMVLFLGLQTAAEFIPVPPEAGLVPAIVAFALSLGALAWPVMRGVPWRQVRADLGFVKGDLGVAEPLVGVGGYVMALPIFAVGILITFLLIQLQAFFAGGGSVDDFAPSGGPAHPIIGFAGSGGLWGKVQLLLLASVAAPIVEETMFRGALYRHLRSATDRWGRAFSIIAAGAVSSFIFAAIHPQGWIAVPALGALAFSMALIREWRGTLVPSMVIHAVSNGLVMTLLMIFLSD